MTTHHQTLTFNGYNFLVTRVTWHFERGEDTYSYIVYEPYVGEFGDLDQPSHSSIFHELGQKWGELTTYFVQARFDQYPSGSYERYIQVKAYYGFRQEINDWLIDEAISRKDWLPLPLAA